MIVIHFPERHDKMFESIEASEAAEAAEAAVDNEWEMLDGEGGVSQVMERWHILFGETYQVWEVIYKEASIMISNCTNRALLFFCEKEYDWRGDVVQLAYDLEGKIFKVVMNDGTEIVLQ